MPLDVQVMQRGLRRKTWARSPWRARPLRRGVPRETGCRIPMRRKYIPQGGNVKRDLAVLAWFPRGQEVTDGTEALGWGGSLRGRGGVLSAVPRASAIGRLTTRSGVGAAVPEVDVCTSPPVGVGLGFTAGLVLTPSALVGLGSKGNVVAAVGAGLSRHARIPPSPAGWGRRRRTGRIWWR